MRSCKGVHHAEVSEPSAPAGRDELNDRVRGAYESQHVRLWRALAAWSEQTYEGARETGAADDHAAAHAGDAAASAAADTAENIDRAAEEAEIAARRAAEEVDEATDEAAAAAAEGMRDTADAIDQGAEEMEEEAQD